MISALLAAETVGVGYDSQNYEIERDGRNYTAGLNEAHAAELDEFLDSTLTWGVTSW